MGEIVDMPRSKLPTKDDYEFVVDLARFAEGIVSESDVKKKYRFDNATWDKLGEDDGLVRAIEAEKTRRIRDGSSKREKAQLLVVKAPDVAASIMNSTEASDRHRLDACKVLNDFAANGPENAPAADRFVITINLNGDVEHYDKSISINAEDVAPNGIVAAPQRSLPASIPNKPWDDSDVVAAPTPEQIALESMMKY